MPSLSRPLALALALLPLGLASACATARHDVRVQGESAGRPEPAAFEAHTRTVGDAATPRLTFTSGSAERARLLLVEQGAGGASDLEERAAALFALGAGGDRRDLDLLESYAEAGRLSLRRAAVFALGELGALGYPSLDRLLDSSVTGLEETLLLALLNADARLPQDAPTRPGRERLLGLADDARPQLAAAAAYLRDHALGGAPPSALPALEHYRELRWRAAKLYGFVDGLRWQDRMRQDLYGDGAFLARYVLGSLGGLDLDVVRSHLVELLARRHGPGVLRGILRGAPGALEFLYAEQLWRPTSETEWSEVLDGLAEGPLLPSSEALLRVAFGGDPALRDRAAVLLLRAGLPPPDRWTHDLLAGDRPELAAAVVRAAGDRGDPALVPFVRSMLDAYPHERVQLPGTVALARLGDPRARETVLARIAGGPGRERRLAIGSLASLADDPQVAGWLETAVEGLDLSADERVLVELGRARAGRVRDRQLLRQWLRVGAEPLAERAFVVRTLAGAPEPEDLALFEELFPVEGDPDLSLELALGLARERHPITLEILRRALWGPDWNLSVLAAGRVAKTLGMRTLMDELKQPPVGASDRNLRCVGFGIGEWGGLAAVEELARTLTERDPGLQGAYLGALALRGR